MGIEYFTVGTCERCGRESRLEKPDARRSAEWWSQWATIWPESVTPVTMMSERPTQVVCVDCLTEPEGEQLREARERIDEELPF
jgi:hypothetical protein